jgi:membrane-bound serine protease (ClpP class)
MTQDPAMPVFFGLLVSGLLLLGAEVFVPGAVLGVFGGLCLLGACIAGFQAFPGYGPHITAAVLVLSGVSIAVWIRFFPGSPLGRRMTVSRDLGNAHAGDETLAVLVGRRGTAASDLRPAGYARIDGQRVDVVTQGGMISKGEPVRVLAVEGSRVVVGRDASPSLAAAVGATKQT